MLGNLVAFLFSGVNITSALLSKLDKQHHPRVWSGVYADVLPYLQEAFTAVIEEQIKNIDEELIRDEAILLIKELCNP